QPPLVSWHFSLLAPQALVPISADHCLLQKVPECSVPPSPSSFADSGLLLCLYPSVVRSPRSSSGQVVTPENNLPRDSSGTDTGPLSSGHRSERSVFLHPSPA